MTRFARARGSKACNERQEEEATPWSVMRQQLNSRMGHTQFPEPSHTLEKPTKPVNTNNFQLQEQWSEFDESAHKQDITNIAIKKQKKAKKIKATKLNKIVKEHFLDCKKVEESVIDSTSQNSLSVSDRSITHVKSKSVNKKNKSEVAITSEPDKKLSKKAAQIKKTKISAISTSKNNKTNNLCINEDISSNHSKELTNNTNTITKMKKKPVNINKINTQDTTSKKQRETHSKQTASKNITNHWLNKESHTIIANGREIHVVRYDGFFVKKDDAIELKKLRKKLRAQNIPSDKIKMVLKLERRKAEKALAREKSSVCFQCRQFGHNFADCPGLKDSDVPKSGMCFKCGSMEHTYFECQISQNQNFRFALCFVCKEQGHIARQCPANANGQYPKGGACHLCGEITHMRKNCPKAVVETPSCSLTLEAHSKYSGLEDISGENVVKNSKADERKNKVVKF